MTGTELQYLRNLPSIKSSTSCSPIISKENESDDEFRYTSLKDIIVNSPPCHTASYEGYEFDPPNIMIRNQLVKHAASVYVQSATILVSRNQNWVMGFWEKMKDKVGWFSCWKTYVWYPLTACLRPIGHLFVCYY